MKTADLGATGLARRMAWPPGKAYEQFAQALRDAVEPELQGLEERLEALAALLSRVVPNTEEPCWGVRFRRGGVDFRQLAQFVPGDAVELEGHKTSTGVSFVPTHRLDPVAQAHSEHLEQLRESVRALRQALDLPRTPEPPEDVVALVQELPLDAMEVLVSRCKTPGEALSFRQQELHQATEWLISEAAKRSRPEDG